ncbi:MAG: glycoside hydrolase family 5 protein, partial [Polyangiaceae bacterium]
MPLAKRAALSHWDGTMLRLAFACALGLFALSALGCDAGSSSAPPPPPPDPQLLDLGDNSDVGSGDIGPTPVELHGQLQVVGSELRDASNNKVQLKGVSSMWLNWEDTGYAESLPALEWMRNNWHLSVIRAAMGVEPAGAYLTNPEAAKKKLTTVVDNAIAAGVYVIIDWHDHHALDHQAESLAFFTEMATKYAGVPNVLYEDFNEPTNDPTITTWAQIKPYHTAVVSAIRGAGSNGIVILGTSTWSQDVDVASQDPLVGANLMYTLHFYACTHGPGLINKGKAAMERGLALFVTEWGATNADGGLDGEVCQAKAQVFLDWMEPAGISWTAWKLDNCTPDSSCLLSAAAPLTGG